jgi:hypothetical protein
MNLKELEKSEAMKKVTPNKGSVLNNLIDFIEQTEEPFHRLHVSAYIVQNTERELKDVQINTLIQTVRSHFTMLTKKGVIESTGERDKSFKVLMYKRKGNTDEN